MRYVVIMLIAALMGSAGCVALPTWHMAQLEGLDASRWTQPAAEGDQTYRAARADKQAFWTVPAWWGDGARPPKGTVYVLEVRYRDTVGTPAVFLSHAGFPGRREIHRFGGTADGKWKTAHIPVSWDLLSKVAGQDATAFSILARGADLPVSTVTVRPAREGDAQRFGAETRQWVARANVQRFGDVKPHKQGEPVVPEALRDQPLVPFVRPYTVSVLPGSVPQQGEVGAALKVRMTLDEYEPAAFGVYANKRDLKGVTFALSPLTNPQGTLDCQVELLTAEYVPSGSGQGDTRRPARLLPMRLWPAYPVDIPAGQSHWFWITLKTEPARVKPGTYTGQVQIAGEGVQGVVPIEVEVLPITLLTARQIDVPMGGCVMSLPPEQEMITYGQHNQCSIHVFGPYLVDVENVDGQLQIGFDRLDEWMNIVTANGVTDLMWFFGNPNGYPDTLTLERQLFRSRAKDRAERIALRKEFIERHHAFKDKPETAAVLPEVRPLYTQWVQKVAAHGKAKGWPRLMLHPFDEPAKWVQRSGAGGPQNVLGRGPWLKFHFKDAAALIHEASSDVLVAGDIHHAEPGIVFLPDVDVFCTNAIHEDPKLGDKVRAAGKAFWQYRGCNATMPPFEPRHTYGFYFGAFDSRGGLIWATNWGAGFDYNEQQSWMHSWYTPFGTIVAPSYEGLREGMDDRRLIETCKARLADDAKAMAMLDAMFQEVVATRIRDGRDVVKELYEDPTQIAKLDRWRSELLDALVRASK